MREHALLAEEITLLYIVAPPGGRLMRKTDDWKGTYCFTHRRVKSKRGKKDRRTEQERTKYEHAGQGVTKEKRERDRKGEKEGKGRE